MLRVLRVEAMTTEENERAPLWTRTEVWECPRCQSSVPATVGQWPGDPWARFVAECLACGYVITESEANTLDEER